MKKSSSRLTILMDMLGVSGSDLAAALHVDRSLISKWRTKERQLSRRSVYLKPLVQFFLSVNSPAGQRYLGNVLKNYRPDIDVEDPTELRDTLSRWLTDTSQDFTLGNAAPRLSGKSSYTAYFEAFHGNKGRRDAVKLFLDEVLQMPEGQELLLISQEDLSWMVEDQIFLQEWSKKLYQVIARHHRIQIIHWVDRNLDSLQAIITRWLPLHLTGGIKSWFFPRYVDLDAAPKMTLFIVADAMAVVGTSYDNSSQNRYTGFFTDPITLKQCEFIFLSILQQCRQLIEVQKLDITLDRLAESVANSNHQAQRYQLSSLPLFSNIPTDLLNSVLEDHDVPADLQALCRKLHQRLAGGNSPKRQVFDLNALSQAVHNGQAVDYELSAVTGMEITFHSSHLRTYLASLVEKLTIDAEFQVGLVSSLPQFTPVPVSLWIEQNKSVAAWSTGLPQAAFASEPTVVNAFFAYFETLWNSIPRVNRDRDWVIAQLQQLSKHLDN